MTCASIDNGVEEFSAPSEGVENLRSSKMNKHSRSGVKRRGARVHKRAPGNTFLFKENDFPNDLMVSSENKIEKKINNLMSKDSYKDAIDEELPVHAVLVKQAASCNYEVRFMNQASLSSVVKVKPCSKSKSFNAVNQSAKHQQQQKIPQPKPQREMMMSRERNGSSFQPRNGLKLSPALPFVKELIRDKIRRVKSAKKNDAGYGSTILGRFIKAFSARSSIRNSRNLRPSYEKIALSWVSPSDLKAVPVAQSVMPTLLPLFA